MNKNNIISVLKQAKPEHIKLIKQAHSLMNNDISKDEIHKPIACTDCLLGRWHDTEGFKLVNIPQLAEAETLHREIHKLYTTLYYTTYDRRKTARSTIISAGVEVPIEEKQFRNKKLKLLEKKTVKLIQSLNHIEKKVEAMNEQYFSSPWLT